MRDPLRNIGIPLVLFLVAVYFLSLGIMLKIEGFTDTWTENITKQCTEYGEITGYEVQFSRQTYECYVKVDGVWYLKDQIRVEDK